MGLGVRFIEHQNSFEDPFCLRRPSSKHIGDGKLFLSLDACRVTLKGQLIGLNCRVHHALTSVDPGDSGIHLAGAADLAFDSRAVQSQCLFFSPIHVIARAEDKIDRAVVRVFFEGLFQQSNPLCRRGFLLTGDRFIQELQDMGSIFWVRALSCENETTGCTCRDIP